MFSNKYEKNLDLLRDFVDENDLQDNHSHIFFNCFYTLKSETLNERIDCEASITFEFPTEGEIKIIKRLDSEKLDHKIYPTQFLAKFQDFDLEYGVITVRGKHPNKEIGKYTAYIEPYGKTNI